MDIEKTLYEELKEKGIENVIIVDKKTGEQYQFSPEHFMTSEDMHNCNPFGDLFNLNF